MNLNKYRKFNIGLLSIVLLFMAMVFIMACDMQDIGNVEHAWEDHWTVTGRVINTEGATQGDIEVTTVGLSEEFSATASQGAFTLTIKYPRGTETLDKVLLKYEDLVDGEYITTYRTAYFTPDDEDTVNVADGPAGPVVLVPFNSPETVVSGAATVVTDGEASLTIPDGGIAAGASVSFTDMGSVEEKDGGLLRFPGEFKGINAEGTLVPFRALGLIDVTAVDANGDKLDLAVGTTAEVVIPVPGVTWDTHTYYSYGGKGPLPEDLSETGYPTTISAWYLDETDGVWKEDGDTSLTLIAIDAGLVFGSPSYSFAYVGQISHFSKWITAEPFEPTYTEIQVVDEEAVPVTNAQVTVYAGNWMVRGYTDSEGYLPREDIFSDLDVPAGYVPVPSDSTDISVDVVSGNFKTKGFSLGTTGEAGASATEPVVVEINMATTFVYGQVTWEAGRPTSTSIYGLYIAFEDPEGNITYGYIDANDDDNYGNYVYLTGWDPQYLTLKPNTLYKVYVSERFDNPYGSGNPVINFDGFDIKEWTSGEKGEMKRFFPTYIGVEE